MTIQTFEIALRAQQSIDSPLEQRLFGAFSGKDIEGNDVQLAFAANRYAYVGSPLALELWFKGQLPFWEPYTDLTKNVRPNECLPDEVIVKSYEENEHLRDQLLALGYFLDTGKRIQSGFAELEIWQLTDSFGAAFNLVHTELQPA